MITLLEAVKLTKKPADRDEVVYKDGDTSDIIKTVLIADKMATDKRFLKRLAPLLKGRNDYETARNVWNWTKKNIPYVKDKLGYERIRLPHKTIWDSYRFKDGGDCKTFTIFVCDLLRELGIKSIIRFIAQKGQSKATHVYTVALIDGKEVVTDAVYTKFDSEPYYSKKWDYDATTLNEINGLNSQFIL
jgi:hypothetical protein